MHVRDIRNSQNFPDLYQQVLAAEYDDFQVLDDSVRGVQFGFGVFVTQSLDRRNSGLRGSRPALVLDVQMEHQEFASTAGRVKPMPL